MDRRNNQLECCECASRWPADKNSPINRDIVSVPSILDMLKCSMIGWSIPEGADDAKDAFKTNKDEATVLQVNGPG
jgi:hypothetical protein